MTEHITDPAKPSLIAMATEALENAAWDWSAAVDELHRTIGKARCREIVAWALHELVRRAVAERRAGYYATSMVPTETKEKGKQTLESHAVVMSRLSCWLEYPMPGGGVLGDSTHDQVTAAADHNEALARTNGRKSRWLRLIAARVPFGRKVREVLTDEQIAALDSEAAQ